MRLRPVGSPVEREIRKRIPMEEKRNKLSWVWWVVGIVVVLAIFQSNSCEPPPPTWTPTPTTRPSPTPTWTPSPTPTKSSRCPSGCITPPPGCDIKGNISFNTGEKIYHVPGQEYYDETIIRPEYGERWFCTEYEAIANGWRKSKR